MVKVVILRIVSEDHVWSHATDRFNHFRAVFPGVVQSLIWPPQANVISAESMSDCVHFLATNARTICVGKTGIIAHSFVAVGGANEREAVATVPIKQQR